MATSHSLGKHFESFVQAQLASGRYNNASEVVRDALRMMEERERRLGALDSAIGLGLDLADVEAGRVSEAQTVSERLNAKFTRMTTEPWERWRSFSPTPLKTIW